ncbi:hypothetical protein AMS68_007689 [Peltaster fructicola]|uniref:Uncharacterized protein n=1 Tax=Peltaster fructicola TaxID=286661 RepID=A0A6H0Y558_9PEZI|nr:hypothetical protein AMS68_007689 [Peltaster fructicola]
MGSNAIVALSAPPVLAPFLSLPKTQGGSTGFYSPIITKGTTTWGTAPIESYTPLTKTYLVDYGLQPSVRITLGPDVMPAATTSHDPIMITEASTTSPSSFPTTDSTAASTPAPGQATTLSPAAVGGIVAGALILLTLILSLWWWQLNRRRSRSRVASGLSTWRKVCKTFDTLSSSIAAACDAHPSLATSMLMILSLLLAILSALGHHLFFSKLNQTEVQYWATVTVGRLTATWQQLNSYAGNALAILTKILLSIAVGIAYMQVFWYAAKRHPKPCLRKVAELDTAYGALNNPLVVFHVPLWLHNRALILIAVTAWLLPIIAVVSPGTLQIQPQPKSPTPTFDLSVPNLDMRSLAFSSTISGVIGQSGYGYDFTYNGPSMAVERVAGAVALQGSILPITAPFPNATWSIRLQGPRLHCEEVSDTMRTIIEEELAGFTFREQECFTPPVLVAWSQNSSTPLGMNASRLTQDYAAITIVLIPSLLKASSKAPWNPAACERIDSSRDPKLTPLIMPGDDALYALSCSLVESNYNIYFDYANGSQTIVGRTSGNSDPVQPIASFSYVKAGNISDADLHTLTYSSIFAAFLRTIQGDIRSGLTEQTSLLVNSGILSTVLAQAKEMSFLDPDQVEKYMSPFYRTTLQKELRVESDPQYRGLAPGRSDTGSETLAELIEGLFENITISLLSSADLQPDSSSYTAPKLVTVSSVTYLNYYVYQPGKLWLAYGLGIGFTAMAVTLGLICICLNDAAYSNNFSTVLRIARNAHLSPEMQDRDSSGVDPLPKYISNALIDFYDTSMAKKGDEGSDLAHVEDKQPTAASALLADDESISSNAHHQATEHAVPVILHHANEHNAEP